MANQNKGWVRRTGEYLGFVTSDVQQRDVNGMSAGVMPPSRSDINSISVDQALTIGAVYRCVSIITNSVSQMPLGVYRNGIEIDTPTLIKQPNIDVSQRQFIKETIWSLATHGNAYWRVYGNPVANLEVLDPNAVVVMQDPDSGRRTYWLGANEVRNIKHLRLMTKPGHAKGFGPIQQAQSDLIAALKVQRFADAWFADTPRGMLTTDMPLAAEESQEILDAFLAFLAKNQGTIVSHSGIRYEHFNLKPSEAQMLEVQQAQTVAIARLFGVPATLLASGNEGTSNTYMNQQELWIQFNQTTLIEYMNEVEDALSALLPRGQEVNFKEEALLRMNTQMETAVEVARIESGMTTVNEWREKHGLPPVKEVASNADSSDV